MEICRVLSFLFDNWTGLTNLAHLDISAKPLQYGPWLKVTSRLMRTIWQLWRAALRGWACVCPRYKKAYVSAASSSSFSPLNLFFSTFHICLLLRSMTVEWGAVICVTKQEFYPRESPRECFTKQDKTRGSVATHSLWVQLLQAVYVIWKRKDG